MQSASGSEVLALRETASPLTGDFLLGHRNRTQCVEHCLFVPSFSKPHLGGNLNSLMHKERTPQDDQLVHHQGIYDTAVEISRAQVRLPPFKSSTCETAVAGSFVCKVRQFSATARSVTSANTAPTLSPSFASKPNFTLKPLGLLSSNVVDSVEQKQRCLNSIGPNKSRVQIKVPPVKALKSRGTENNSPYGAPATSFSASSSVPRTTLPFPSFFDVDDADLSPTLVDVVDSAQSRLNPFSADPSSSFSDFLPSFDALDELARWDMATFPSFQSSTDDPGLEQTDDDHSSSSAEGSNHLPPFSTPFGDDDLLENELPFPSVRPRILMENMGVKKSKTVAADKARNLTGSSSGLGFTSSMSRFDAPFLRNEPSSSKTTASFPRDPPASSPPPNLPPPLPKSQRNSPSPLDDDSLARTSTYLQSPPSPPPSSTRRQSPISQTVEPTFSLDQDSSPLLASSPSTSESDTADERMKPVRHRQSKKRFTLSSTQTKKDSTGCHHVGPEDCQLLIVFPQTDHYEFWDMSDNGWVQVPALLCLMTKEPRRWATTPLAMPDVSLIDLQCEDVAVPVPFPSLYLPWSVPSGPVSSISPTSSSLSPSPNTYSTKFLGGKSALDERSVGSSERSKRRRMSMMDTLNKLEEEQSMRPDKISLDGKWVRTHTWPGVEGHHRLHCHEPGQATARGRSTSANPPRGWYLKFWIPIPTRLFMKRETRIFQIRAKVWMMRNEESVVQLDRFETEGLDAVLGEDKKEEDVAPLLAETQMTVSHLRREREMGVW